MRNLTAFVVGTVIASAGLSCGVANAAQADAKRGDKLFEECRACHSVEAGVHGVGPSLKGVFGRKAAALEDFRYSPVMKRSDVTWTPKTMDAYITDPQAFMPANRMPDAKNRADLIEYLQQATK